MGLLEAIFWPICRCCKNEASEAERPLLSGHVQKPSGTETSQPFEALRTSPERKIEVEAEGLPVSESARTWSATDDGLPEQQHAVSGINSPGASNKGVATATETSGVDKSSTGAAPAQKPAEAPAAAPAQKPAEVPAAEAVRHVVFKPDVQVIALETPVTQAAQLEEEPKEPGELASHIIDIPSETETMISADPDNTTDTTDDEAVQSVDRTEPATEKKAVEIAVEKASAKPAESATSSEAKAAATSTQEEGASKAASSATATVAPAAPAPSQAASPSKAKQSGANSSKASQPFGSSGPSNSSGGKKRGKGKRKGKK